MNRYSKYIPVINETTALSQILMWLLNATEQKSVKIQAKTDRASWTHREIEYHVHCYRDAPMTPVVVHVRCGSESYRLKTTDNAIRILAESMGVICEL